MSSGHEQVKAVLVDHLGDHIAEWMVLVRGSDTWPPDPRRVAASDILPEGDDAYPCVHVSSTKKRTDQSVAVGDGTYLADYDVAVTVACKAVKERDVDSASTGRDRLLQAVEWLLIDSPGLGTTTARVLRGLVSDSDPVAVDPKGRPTALGQVRLTVRTTETVPDPAGYGLSEEVSVTVDATDAAHTPDVDEPAHTVTVISE